MWQKLEIVTILALSQGSHNIRDPVSTAIAAAKIDAQIDAQWPHFSKQLSVQTISGRWRHRPQVHLRQEEDCQRVNYRHLPTFS